MQIITASQQIRKAGSSGCDSMDKFITCIHHRWTDHEIIIWMKLLYSFKQPKILGNKVVSGYLSGSSNMKISKVRVAIYGKFN